jgi:hypothetical protein
MLMFITDQFDFFNIFRSRMKRWQTQPPSIHWTHHWPKRPTTTERYSLNCIRAATNSRRTCGYPNGAAMWLIQVLARSLTTLNSRMLRRTNRKPDYFTIYAIFIRLFYFWENGFFCFMVLLVLIRFIEKYTFFFRF